MLLNDNGDGTLSQVGYYKSPLPGSHNCPALIVSQKPRGQRDSSMEPARIPGKDKDTPVAKHQILKKNAKKHAPAVPLQQKGSRPFSDNPKKLWDYILPYLPKPLNSISNSAQVIRLFSITRKRDVEWRTGWRKRSLDDDKSQIAGLLVHLVGEKHFNGDKSCTNCIRGQGPFNGCYVLSKDADHEAHEFVRGCANCLFMHSKEACSIKSSWKVRVGVMPDLDASAAPPVAEWAAAAGYNKKRPRPTDSDIENEEPSGARRRSDRLVQVEDEAQPEPKRKIVTLSLNSKNGRSTPLSGGNMRTAMSRGSPVSAGPSSSSALIRTGNAQPDDLLEMEDWEIAPGRIREVGVESPNNIAFSKSFLEVNQSIPISADVSFEVKTIKSGHSFDLDGVQTKARYCSLATGKLLVRVEGQPEFTIGPHGLFKVAPGVKASVQNRLYVDSVLHISTVA